MGWKRLFVTFEKPSSVWAADSRREVLFDGQPLHEGNFREDTVTPDEDRGVVRLRAFPMTVLPFARPATQARTASRGGLLVLGSLLLAACPACRAGQVSRAPPEVSAPRRPDVVDASSTVADAPRDATSDVANDATVVTTDATTGRVRGYPIFGIRREACAAQGGEYLDGRALSNPRRGPDPVPPTPRCWMPSTLNGSACRDDADCGSGRCHCAGELGGPDVLRRRPELETRDGTPAVGVCADHILEPGAWFCLVHAGRVRLRGIIVD